MTKQLLFISRIPKPCAIPQLVLAPLNPVPIVPYYLYPLHVFDLGL